MFIFAVDLFGAEKALRLIALLFNIVKKYSALNGLEWRKIMKKKNLMFAALIAATAFGMSGCSFINGLFNSPDSSNSGSDGVDTEAPVISVTGVPTSCNVGDTVTLPAATATDNVDGDVSSKVKVTVSQLKADGETVNRDIIYEKAGNVEQTFEASSLTVCNPVIRKITECKRCGSCCHFRCKCGSVIRTVQNHIRYTYRHRRLPDIISIRIL